MACNQVHYRNPTVGVAVIILEQNRILMVERKGSYAGMWCIPCGHVEWDEEIRTAAKREIKEETGLDVVIGPVFNVYSNFHLREKQTVGIWFLGKAIGGRLRAGSDASRAEWFPLDAVPGKLAFPTDFRIIRELQKRFASKADALFQ